MTTRDILQKHDKFLTSLIDVFDENLKPVIDRARKRTLKTLEGQLTFAQDGSIEYTPANQRALRSIDRIFKRHMKVAGYDKVAGAFTDQFADHLPRFEKVLNDISDTLDTPLPKISFTSADVDLFASQAVGAKEMLLDVVETAGAAAKRQALFSVGGLKFSDLASELSDKFGKTLSEAKGIADTATSVFYRTIASQSYAKIEDGLIKGAVVYQYMGPDDDLTRPFCEMLLARTAAKPMTREEIDQLDNGSGLGSPFTSGGGYRCRHVFVLGNSDQRKAAA